MNITTEHIAMYAAALSTCLVGLEIYKHFTKGAKISIEALKNRAISHDPLAEEGSIWVQLSVVNKGDQATTITNTHYTIYDNHLSKILKKESLICDCPNPLSSQPLPVVLLPGEIWVGMIQQHNKLLDLDLDDVSKNKIVIMQVSVAHKKKTINKRLR